MKHVDNLKTQTDDIKVKDKKIKPIRRINEDTLESVSGGSIGYSGAPLISKCPICGNERLFCTCSSKAKGDAEGSR